MEHKPDWLVEHEESDNREFGEIKHTLERIEERLERMEVKQEPLNEMYEGTVFAKKFLTGLGAIVISIAAIGGGILWFVSTIKNH